MQSRLARILLVTFFLGLPFAGLMLFWKDAHRKIEDSAAPFARQASIDLLSKWDKQLLDDLGTTQFRATGAEDAFAKGEAKYGKFVALEDWKTLKSSVGSRDDMVWQFVSFTGQAKFEKGSAQVNMTLARRTMNPEWRVEAFELVSR